jgi:glycosyltransferase involved in cell wall biosynthesis
MEGRAASMAYPSCSVIITTCDRPDELRRSIASVIGQTVRPQELIVVDDYSSHPNESAVAEYSGNGLKIHYHRLTQRSGASAARNAGARLASGEILMFLDDDDVWEPRKVETQLSLFATHHEAAAVYTGMLAVDDTNGGKVLHASRDHLSGKTWPQILFRNFVGPTSAVAMRAQVFHDLGGFDQQLPALQDYDLWLRLSMAGPMLYDGAHNLRFSAISASASRISQNPRKYQEGFAYLRRKYRSELSSLTPWQRRHFRAQSKLVEASKYLEQADHADAVAQMILAISLYPPIVGRLSRALVRTVLRDPPFIAHAQTVHRERRP